MLTQVTSFEQMIKCLEDGTKHRTTAATKMNQTSSRSHAIFTITIENTIHSSSPNLTTAAAAAAAPPTTTTTTSAIAGDDSPDDEETTPPIVPSTRGNGQAEVRRSKFHFVDLAGSERAKRTGAQGNTLKEGFFRNLKSYLNIMLRILIDIYMSSRPNLSFVPKKGR